MSSVKVFSFTDMASIFLICVYYTQWYIPSKLVYEYSVQHKIFKVYCIRIRSRTSSSSSASPTGVSDIWIHASIGINMRGSPS